MLTEGPMLAEAVVEPLKPYVTDSLFAMAQRGIKQVGGDMVLFLDTSTKEMVAYERQLFLKLPTTPAYYRRELNESARNRLAKTMKYLSPVAVSFWFVALLPNGIIVTQALTLPGNPLTTYKVGLA